MKRAWSVFILSAVLGAVPVSASVLSDLECMENELGLEQSDKSTIDRIAELERQLGITASEDAAVIERVDALKSVLGITENEAVQENNTLSTEETASDSSPLLTVEEYLQGTWEHTSVHNDFTSGEVITFFDGELSYYNFNDEKKGSDHPTYGTYEVTDENVITVINDFRSYFDYVLGEDGLELSLTVDTGWDKGIPRVFVQTEKGSLSEDYRRSILNRTSSGEALNGSKETNAVTDTENAVSRGERNALQRANEYLEYMAFSYTGLIDQLKYEGFSDSEARYGADQCGADWYEQAERKAKDYLDFMSFSKSGLINQLEYEGFTYDQALYGAAQNGY